MVPNEHLLNRHSTLRPRFVPPWASISVMPKVIFDKLNFTHLTPTPMHLQLADSSVCYPEGIAEDVPVRVRDYFIPVDFVVLDMEISKETTLILGRPYS